MASQGSLEALPEEFPTRINYRPNGKPRIVFWRGDPEVFSCSKKISLRFVQPIQAVARFLSVTSSLIWWMAFLGAPPCPTCAPNLNSNFSFSQIRFSLAAAFTVPLLLRPD
ncbi:hypothetical protein HAX54_036547 [Datura stramonium]|uniref:Uncharacterized protein n=1 Tax=Datura stramonium TaxID=4076 RepID=A0ABS8SG79_DATST|nr:hypothetical protein [Datura stramonium]